MVKAIRMLALLLAVGGAGVSASARQSHAGCHDTIIKRVASPDGSLVVQLYYRDCTSVSYTVAMMRTRPSLLLPEGDEVCHLVTLRGRLKIEAVWRDAKHVHISSPDRLSWDLGISSRQDACNDIKVSYDLNVEEAPPEELSDPKLAAALREAVDLAAPCLADRHHPEHPQYFYREIEAGGHREALGLLLWNLYQYRCPVSRRAYSLMKRASAALKIERGELEQLRPQVTTLARAERIISDIRREAAAARARVRRRPPDPAGTPPPRLFGTWLDHKRGFIDSATQIVIEPQFAGDIEEFSGGMAKISAPLESLAANTKYGYIDRTGRMVIRPRYELAHDFSEGLAVVEVRGKGYGYIDAKGRLVIGPGFYGAWDFTDGIARVSTQERGTGYINKQGRYVWGPFH
jgi:hypothetical protein